MIRRIIIALAARYTVNDMNKFTNKVVVITGRSSGGWRALAHEQLRAGRDF
jgi:hypothetical protein